MRYSFTVDRLPGADHGSFALPHPLATSANAPTPPSVGRGFNPCEQVVGMIRPRRRGPSRFQAILNRKERQARKDRAKVFLDLAHKGFFALFAPSRFQSCINWASRVRITDASKHSGSPSPCKINRRLSNNHTRRRGAVSKSALTFHATGA